MVLSNIDVIKIQGTVGAVNILEAQTETLDGIRVPEGSVQRNGQSLIDAILKEIFRPDVICIFIGRPRCVVILKNYLWDFSCRNGTIGELKTELETLCTGRIIIQRIILMCGRVRRRCFAIGVRNFDPRTVGAVCIRAIGYLNAERTVGVGNGVVGSGAVITGRQKPLVS